MKREYPPYENTTVPIPGRDRHILEAIASDPLRFGTNLYYYDEEVVTIYDAFPKSRFHLLLLPRRYISSVSSLTPSNLGPLRHMIEIGTEIATFLTQKYLSSTQEEQKFMLGFHAVPSLDQLHMHIISTDFVSPFLKTRKHWNSFHTDFFLPASYVMSEVSAGRRLVTANDKGKYLSLLKQPLFCHRCKEGFQNMKTLKQHIQSCSYPFVVRQKADSPTTTTIDKYIIHCDSLHS